MACVTILVVPLTVTTDGIEKIEQLFNGTLRYVTFCIKDDKDIIVTATGGSDASVDEFKSRFKQEWCSAGVFAKSSSDVILITWKPEDGEIKFKILYDTVQEKLQEALGSRVNKNIVVTDEAELQSALE